MRNFFLKSKNSIAKLVLAFLGFTLAASQCLAQYMVIRPRVSVHGKLKGITDTISRFKIVINSTDTLYTSWAHKYTFEYHKYTIQEETDTIEVSEDIEKRKPKYMPAIEIVAIKSDENDGIEKDLYIELEKKKKRKK